MKKESVIVGIFGLSLGLLVAWGIWNFKSAAPKPQELISVSPTPIANNNTEPIPTAQPTSSLNLISPQDDYVATQSSILLSGKTKPGSTVVISTNLDDFALTSPNGDFSQTVNLEEGENTLMVTAYHQDKTQETTERSVVYTKEAL